MITDKIENIFSSSKMSKFKRYLYSKDVPFSLVLLLADYNYTTL